MQQLMFSFCFQSSASMMQLIIIQCCRDPTAQFSSGPQSWTF